MDADLDKTLALINGQSPSEYENTQLSESDKAQIDNAIEVLFSGLSLKRWLSDITLGDAWTAALDDLRNMIFAISVDNVASRYARVSIFKHRARWLNKINLTLHVNKKIQCPVEKRSTWLADAETKIQNGYEILYRKIMEFSSATPRKPATPDLVPVFKQVFQEKSSRNIEHEREQVREY
jgi:hypothetical protein